jgi:nucleoside 2-deoxyribosyltransferase
MKPLVYLAGPFSLPDPFVNTREAVLLADEVLCDGIVTPVCPHLSALWHLIRPRPYQTWLAYDIELLARCDALLRFGGESSGAEKEVIYAREHGIPVFSTLNELYKWAEDIDV